MRRLQQLITHDPTQGRYGDCWRTCIAMILDYESPIDVPHFAEMSLSGEQIDVLTNEWLSEKGFALASIVFREDEHPWDWMKIMNPHVPMILLGQSGIGEINHCVVCLGGEVWHDPNGSGVVGPCIDDGDGRFWWIYMISVAP